VGSLSTHLRVAAAQILVDDDVTGNRDRILRAIKECSRRECDAVVFPETALTGYSPAIGQGRDSGEWPEIQAALNAICDAAAAASMWVIVGSECWEDRRWWNRLYAISPDGRVSDTYDKAHLMAADRAYYTRGSRDTIIEIGGVRAGLQICYDVRFPEGYRELVARGAELVLQGFYGAGGNTWKVPVIEAHLVSRAAESGCFIVAANVANSLQIVRSMIVDPLGMVLARANQDYPEIIVADLNMARVGESEIRHDYLRLRSTQPG